MQAVDHVSPNDRSEREPDRPGCAECRTDRPDAMRRTHVAQRGEHDPGVAQLQAGQEKGDGELSRFAGQRDAREDDHLHHRAADDDRAPAVLVRPYAPERHEEDAEHKDERGEDAGERGDLGRQ